MRKLDLTGKTFNRLTVIKEVPNSKKDTYWLCQCSCGKFVEIKGTAIKNGTTKSCGCLALEIAQNLAKETEIVENAHDGYNKKRVDGIATFLINDKIQKNNKTGYKGVLQYRLADGSARFKAYLTVGGKVYSKRGFSTSEEAYNYRLGLVEKYVPKERQNDKNNSTTQKINLYQWSTGKGL
ncbi:hypothetical protein [Streptococcus agalactiae]|uniref:hypothetical protein n=1 Tax=Streptococcus agalactiae TaxID=1311 RepID=UPI000332E12B|nr:hypothetical protein [Streptococcus agalactiae]CCW39536.1 hypothetical protein MSA_6740 [Streptococcus agalactiae ILRI005]